MDVARAVELLRGARRVAVVGNGGSGKSTFAARLGRLVGLPVVHLDQMFWRAGWVQTPAEEWEVTHAALVAAEAWVLDGNYGGTQEARFAAADVVVFLDLPAWRCVLAAIRRSVRHFGRTRPDLAPGCPERVDRGFLLWVWRFGRTSRPHLVGRLAAHPPRCGVVHLRSRREVTRVLDALRA